MCFTDNECPMLKLYHADTAVCAAKVRLTLVEKALPWDSELLNLGRGDQFLPNYLALNKNGVVPTLLHDGKLITESTVINEYLDETFPELPLRPTQSFDRARMHLWTKREDTIHDAINTLSVVLYFRTGLLQKSPEEQAERYNLIPSSSRREKWRELLEHGLTSPHFAEALYRFARLLTDMEEVLLNERWLVGESLSLADIGLLSFFYRLELLNCSGMWREHFPHVTRWFEQFKKRESFAVAIANYISQSRRDDFLSISAPFEIDVMRAFQSSL